MFPINIAGKSIPLDEENGLSMKYSFGSTCKFLNNSGSFSSDCDFSSYQKGSSFVLRIFFWNFRWKKSTINEKVIFRIGQMLVGDYGSKTGLPILMTNVPSRLDVFISVLR